MSSHTLHNIDLPNGKKGIFRTVKEMIHRIKDGANNARVKKLALSLRGSTSFDTIKNIYEHVTSNYTYMVDSEIAKILKNNFKVKEIDNPEETELLNHPKNFLFGELPISTTQTVPLNYGDCDCVSMGLGALLLANGIPVIIKIIAVETEQYEHVYVLAFVKEYNAWIPLDAVLYSQGFGYEVAPVKRSKTFEVK